MVDRNGKQESNDGEKGECKGCDEYTAVNDLGLCDGCAAKLDRDMVRARDWDYSVSAFGVPKEKREDLRNHIIKTYGRSMELIADEAIEKKEKETKNRKKAKRRKQRRRTRSPHPG